MIRYRKMKYNNAKTTTFSIPIDTIFKKKRCKECNSKLVKINEHTELYKGDKEGFHPGIVYNGTHYETKIKYKCYNCGRVHDIEEFSDRFNKDNN